MKIREGGNRFHLTMGDKPTLQVKRMLISASDLKSNHEKISCVPWAYLKKW
jgi:hypothetical protein